MLTFEVAGGVILGLLPFAWWLRRPRAVRSRPTYSVRDARYDVSRVMKDAEIQMEEVAGIRTPGVERMSDGIISGWVDW